MRYTRTPLEEILPPCFQSGKNLEKSDEIIQLRLVVLSEAGGWKVQSSPGQVGELAKVNFNNRTHSRCSSRGHGVAGSPPAESLPSPGGHHHTWVGGGFQGPVAVGSAHLPAPVPRACANAGGPAPLRGYFSGSADAPQRQDGGGAAGRPRWSGVRDEARVRH